jgi:hypothetical protein
MGKEFIQYEQALALKELGFNEPCFAWYGPTGIFNDWDKTDTIAPLYQQAFRWFREKHKLSGTPQYFTGGFYCYTINDMKDTEKSNRLFTEFETHEEAELACLIKLIEIVKNG